MRDKLVMATQIKSILLHFTHEEHNRLKQIKNKLNMSWEEFLIFLSHTIK